MENYPASAQNSLLAYDGSTPRIYGVWLKNLVLGILTLGIYRAWGKSRLRRYLWSSFSVMGDRLTYTGKGGELFRGYVKFGFMLTIISIVASIIDLSMGVQHTDPHHKQTTFGSLLTMLFFIYMIYFSRFSALRYRLSRTSWRGIRGHLEGNGRMYVLFRFKRAFMNIISLGFLTGRSDMLDNHYLASRVSLGSQKCTYTGDIGALDGINAVTLLLAIPTLGISRYWYKAALLNQKYNNLHAGSVYFRANFTPGQLFKLSMGNLLILILTLFIGIPIAIQRIMRCLAEHVEVLGSIEGSNIVQAQDGKVGSVGEGMADHLDYDGMDFDLGLI